MTKGFNPNFNNTLKSRLNCGAWLKPAKTKHVKINPFVPEMFWIVTASAFSPFVIVFHEEQHTRHLTE